MYRPTAKCRWNRCPSACNSGTHTYGNGSPPSAAPQRPEEHAQRRRRTCGGSVTERRPHTSASRAGSARFAAQYRRSDPAHDGQPPARDRSGSGTPPPHGGTVTRRDEAAASLSGSRAQATAPSQTGQRVHGYETSETDRASRRRPSRRSGRGQCPRCCHPHSCLTSSLAHRVCDRAPVVLGHQPPVLGLRTGCSLVVVGLSAGLLCATDRMHHARHPPQRDDTPKRAALTALPIGTAAPAPPRGEKRPARGPCGPEKPPPRWSTTANELCC